MKGKMDIQPKRALPYIEPLIDHCGEQFPRHCQNCGRRFEDFIDYVSTTTPIGAVCWDVELVNGAESLLDDPVGTLSMANCTCGTTLSVGCLDRESGRYRMFLEALQRDAEDSGVTVVAVMDALRVIVRSAVGSD